MLHVCSLAHPVLQEEAGEAEAVVVDRVRVDLAEGQEQVGPWDMVRAVGIGVTSITMPRELVGAEVMVEVVVQMVDPGLVVGVALAPALVRVVR